MPPRRKQRGKAKPKAHDPGSTEELEALLRDQISLHNAAANNENLEPQVKENCMKLRRSLHSWAEKEAAVEIAPSMTSDELLSMDQELTLRDLSRLIEQELKQARHRMPPEPFDSMEESARQVEKEFTEAFLEPHEKFVTETPQWKPSERYILDDRDKDYKGGVYEQLIPDILNWEDSLPAIPDNQFGSGAPGNIERRLMVQSFLRVSRRAGQQDSGDVKQEGGKDT